MSISKCITTILMEFHPFKVGKVTRGLKVTMKFHQGENGYSMEKSRKMNMREA